MIDVIEEFVACVAREDRFAFRFDLDRLMGAPCLLESRKTLPKNLACSTSIIKYRARGDIIKTIGIQVRRYGSSQCFQCQGCRFVLGKMGQCYLRCEFTEVRYPVQPILECGSLSVHHHQPLILTRDQEQVTDEFRWASSSLIQVQQRIVIGTFVDFTSIFGVCPSTLHERNAPHSSLLWVPSKKGLGYFMWSSEPCRGLLLGWSKRVLSVVQGDELTFL